MSDERTLRRVVIAACAVSVVAALVSVPLLVLTWRTDVPGATLPKLTTFVLEAPSGLWFTAVGAVVAWHRPRNAVGWLLLAAGVLTTLAAPAKLYALYGLFTDPGSLTAAPVAAWVGQHIAGANLGLLIIVFLLVPDGRLPSPRWRPVLWGAVAGTAVGLLGTLRPGRTLEAFPLLDNPFGMSGTAATIVDVADSLSGVLLLPVMIAGLSALVARYRHSDAEQRAQLKWVAYGVALVCLSLFGVLVSVAVTGGQDEFLPALMVFLAAITALPGFIAIAVIRHRLFDIDVLIRRSLVYGAISALIVVAWIGAATILGVAVARTGPAVLAVLIAVVVVLALQPVRHWLDAYAERRVYGRRVSGPDLLAQVGDLLEHSLDAGQLTDRLSHVLRDGLGLRWVRVRGPEQHPQEDADLTMPLAYAGTTVGVLEAGYRRGAELTTSDRRLLERLLGQVALAVHNARQATELAESRARIIRAQDAERRRIGRNIHDGIQQQLVALGARLRLARNQFGRDPALADATLATLQADIRRSVDDLRELSRGIHPSVLSDRGLLEAVESLLTFVPLPVRLVADPDLRSRRLPEPVEEAGYFVVSEALANVLKHAHAHTVRVSLAVSDGVLEIGVADDGVGFARRNGSGSGLRGLADRLDVLGGRLSVDGAAGTSLLARLPLGDGGGHG